MNRPVLTFECNRSEKSDVVVSVGHGLDGLDTQDIVEMLIEKAPFVTDISLDMPNGQRINWRVTT